MFEFGILDISHSCELIPKTRAFFIEQLLQILF